MGNNQEILETLDILIEHSKKCRPSETGHHDAKLLVSRREFGIDKDEFKERLFRMIQRVWQKEYDTAHIKLLRAAKTLIDAEIEKINERRKSKGLPCG